MRWATPGRSVPCCARATAAARGCSAFRITTPGPWPSSWARCHWRASSAMARSGRWGRRSSCMASRPAWGSSFRSRVAVRVGPYTAAMPVIDADAHVVESDRTWDYLDPSDRKYRTELVHPQGSQRAQWLIDGKLRGNPLPAITHDQLDELSRQAGRVMDTPREARELEDVTQRLRHMDELGIDVQVMYPTMFIQEVGRPEI